jgi:hypothetical protein
VIEMYQVSRLHDYNVASRGAAAAAELKGIPRLRPYVELRLVGNSIEVGTSKLHFNFTFSQI